MVSKLTVTTSLPAMGPFLINELAKNNSLELVIIQKTKHNINWRSILIEIIPSIIQKSYYIFKTKNLKVFIKNKYKVIDELALTYNFDTIYTININKDEKVKKKIESIKSKYILVLGGRILKKHLIESTDSMWINGHGGILPEFRGLCSEYWALKTGNPNKIGSTIHELTEKIDNGRIISIKDIRFNKLLPLFVIEAINHYNLIINYLYTAKLLINSTYKTTLFNQNNSNYYSSPRLYALTRYLPAFLIRFIK